MHGPSRTNKPAAGRRSVEFDNVPDGYAWNHYGRDAMPDDEDPYPVAPVPRRRRRSDTRDDESR